MDTRLGSLTAESLTMTKREDRLAPMHGTVPKQKRRIGVLPTRREADKKKQAEQARRPARWEREATNSLALISHM